MTELRTDWTERTDFQRGTGTGDPVLRALLEEVSRFLSDYTVFPSPYAIPAASLWIAHSWVVDRFDSTPRLAILSASKGCGKTRVLEAIEALVPEPVRSASVSAAVLFRLIEKRGPTVLIDECDLLLGRDGDEDVKALVNAGHRKGEPVLRCVGKDHEPTEFKSYAAVVLAGIGNLPETIMDRCVILRIRKRSRAETVKRWRAAEAGPRGRALADQLKAWASVDWEPQYPEDEDTISDRLADVWEPLFVIADLAGGSWPQLAREAVKELTETEEIESHSLRLLREIREHWPQDREWWSTRDMLLMLHTLEESPWGSEGGYGDKGISAYWLSQALKPYGIASVRNKDRSARGYSRASFQDAWERYLSGKEAPDGR